MGRSYNDIDLLYNRLGWCITARREKNHMTVQGCMAVIIFHSNLSVSTDLLSRFLQNIRYPLFVGGVTGKAAIDQL